MESNLLDRFRRVESHFMGRRLSADDAAPSRPSILRLLKVFASMFPELDMDVAGDTPVSRVQTKSYLRKIVDFLSLDLLRMNLDRFLSVEDLISEQDGAIHRFLSICIQIGEKLMEDAQDKKKASPETEKELKEDDWENIGSKQGNLGSSQGNVSGDFYPRVRATPEQVSRPSSKLRIVRDVDSLDNVSKSALASNSGKKTTKSPKRVRFRTQPDFQKPKVTLSRTMHEKLNTLNDTVGSFQKSINNELDLLKQTHQHLLDTTLPDALPKELEPQSPRRQSRIRHRVQLGALRKKPPSVRRRISNRLSMPADVHLQEEIERQALQSVKSLLQLTKTALPGIEVPDWIQKSVWKKQLEFYTRAVESARKDHITTERIVQVQETKERIEQEELLDLLINNCKLSEKHHQEKTAESTRKIVESNYKERYAATVRLQKAHTDSVSKVEAQNRKRQAKEEILVKRLIDSSLKEQRDWHREMEKMRKEKEHKEREERRKQLEARRSYLRDRIQLMKEKLETVQEEQRIRGLAIRQETRRHLHDKKKNIKSDIGTIRGRLTTDANDYYFREKDRENATIQKDDETPK